MRTLRTCLALIATLSLTGCLLPQPDTPIIPPLKPESGRNTGVGLPAAAPGDAAGASPERSMPTQDGQAGMAATAPTLAPNPKDAQMAPGQLEGVIGGLEADRVTLVPLAGGEKLVAEVTDRGAFALSLPPGEYWLDFTLAASTQPVRLDVPLLIVSGKARKLTITLAGSPLRATVSEEVPLVETGVATPEQPATP